MPTLMFQPQFAAKVASGTKRQTVRPIRKRPIQPGDKLSLRKWADKAYRSPQLVLREETCTQCAEVRIYGTHPDGFLIVGHVLQGDAARQAFARADGFKSWAEMLEWFRATHGLPFHGTLIRW